jgi:hypothetical protein
VAQMQHCWSICPWWVLNTSGQWFTVSLLWGNSKSTERWLLSDCQSHWVPIWEFLELDYCTCSYFPSFARNSFIQKTIPLHLKLWHLGVLKVLANTSVIFCWFYPWTWIYIFSLEYICLSNKHQNTDKYDKCKVDKHCHTNQLQNCSKWDSKDARSEK